MRLESDDLEIGVARFSKGLDLGSLGGEPGAQDIEAIGIVIDHHDSQAGEFFAWPQRGIEEDLIEIAGGVIVFRWQFHGEFRSFSEALAARLHESVMEFGDATGDGQSEAEAVLPARERGIFLREEIKNTFQEVGCDAFAFIPNTKGRIL